MSDINTEKLEIRRQIISAANIYKNTLAGHVYLYVSGLQYFEVAYKTECFKHLTGVESPLRGNTFYDNAKNATLNASQIYFNNRHPLKTAKKKLVCLHQLPELTKDLVCVVKDMHTATITYKIGITNLEFTVGLTENLDKNGVKLNDWLIPQTLRIKDKAIETAQNAEFIEFIFSKNACEEKYTNLCYSDAGADIPEKIKPLLCESILQNFDTKSGN